MLSPRSWGLFLQAIISLAILFGWFTWPKPEQSWRPTAVATRGNGAVISLPRQFWSGFV